MISQLAMVFLMRRKEGDRTDVPIDFRFLDLLLRTAGDLEVCLGKYAQGVRVGPGTRMPRLPALNNLGQQHGSFSKMGSENLSQNRIYRCAPLRVT